jgi:hypothetical protein
MPEPFRNVLSLNFEKIYPDLVSKRLFFGFCYSVLYRDFLPAFCYNSLGCPIKKIG